MIMLILATLAGFGLLLGGAEFLVRGAVALATRLGVRPLVVGVTVVAFGTSAPELVVSLSAALEGAPALMVGNVVGSNIANVLLVMGTAAVLWPIAQNPRPYRVDILLLLGATVLFMGLMATGTLTRWQGGLMLLLLAAFLGQAYLRARAGETDNPLAAVDEVEEMAHFTSNIWVALFSLLGGLVAVIVGAQLLVYGATGMARSFGVSEAVIGLTLVAFGTSLPELATTLVAARRHHSELALGNVIGSNIFNLLAVGGVTAAVIPIPVPSEMVALDMWVMLASALVMVAFLCCGHIGRPFGAAMLAAYVAYIGWQVIRPDSPVVPGAV